jgi:hypothetical protein
VAAGCGALPWSLEDLESRLYAAAAIAYGKGLRHLSIDLPRIKREELARGAALAAARRHRHAE